MWGWWAHRSIHQETRTTAIKLQEFPRRTIHASHSRRQLVEYLTLGSNKNATWKAQLERIGAWSAWRVERRGRTHSHCQVPRKVPRIAFYRPLHDPRLRRSRHLPKLLSREKEGQRWFNKRTRTSECARSRDAATGHVQFCGHGCCRG